MHVAKRTIKFWYLCRTSKWRVWKCYMPVGNLSVRLGVGDGVF